MSQDTERLQELRSRAKNIMERIQGGESGTLSEEHQQLLQELQVQQIELELQNEELLASQHALGQSRSRYQELFHQAPVGYVVVDESGIIREANTVFTTMVADVDRQLKGMVFAEYLPGEDRKIFHSRWNSFFHHPGEKHMEVRLRTSARTLRHVRLSTVANTALGREGEKGSDLLLLTVTDISDLVAAEEHLQEAHRYMEAILNSLSSHICVLDENGVIVTVNEAWKQFAGENGGGLGEVGEGANYLEVCRRSGSDYARRLLLGIEEIARGDRNYFELEYPCHSEESRRWFVCKVTPLSHAGGSRLVVSHEDVTERRLLEEQRQKNIAQKNQLAKLASLDRMAGAIAHNFNNMLGGVQGFLELALEDAGQGVDIRPILEEALRGAQKASETSSLMLTYLGQASFDKQTVDFVAVCRMALAGLARAMPGNVTLTVDLPPENLLIFADEEQVRTLLANILTNAWEAIGDAPGEIRLSLSSVPADRLPAEHILPLNWRANSERYACLEVSDSGCGISEEESKSIFDPFYSSKFPGRGMGLPVVLGILLGHNGAVTFAGRAGRGTTFRVFLPISAGRRD